LGDLFGSQRPKYALWCSRYFDASKKLSLNHIGNRTREILEREAATAFFITSSGFDLFPFSQSF